jgi:hypothetical protein
VIGMKRGFGRHDNCSGLRDIEALKRPSTPYVKQHIKNSLYDSLQAKRTSADEVGFVCWHPFAGECVLIFRRKENAVLDNVLDPLGDMLRLRSVAAQRLEAAIGHGDVGQIQDWVKRMAGLDKALRQYGIEIEPEGVNFR